VSNVESNEVLGGAARRASSRSTPPRWAARSAAQRMELTGGADCGALGGDEESERVDGEVAGGGSVRVERWVRRVRGTGYGS
jgi:hypothetical protein